MLLTLADLLRDLGFVLYAGPMVAFSLLVVLRSHIPNIGEHEIVVSRARLQATISAGSRRKLQARSGGSKFR